MQGGKTPPYVAGLIMRLDDHNKLKEDKDFGIHGTLVDVSLAKSRSNGVGHFCTLVFDQNIGFDQELSLFYLLKQNNRVGGGGRSFHIKGAEDIKFSQKGFKEKLYNNKELQQVFMNNVLEILQAELEERDAKAYSEEHLDLTSSMISAVTSKVIQCD